MRAVARAFHVSLRTVQIWVARGQGKRLDRVDWNDMPRGGRRESLATSTQLEDLIVQIRRELKLASDLGEFGAAAIRRELQSRQVQPLPSIRTIGRILSRRGALDGNLRVRRKPPPKGWYLPRLAGAAANATCNAPSELDSFDFVEGLIIRGGTDVMVLNTVSLHGGLCGSWIRSNWTSKATVDTLISHWRSHGLPHFAQFDNDTIFHGPHHFPDIFGRVTRLCLYLGVIPVFAPPRETGFQASIENYNGRWQEKVWRRFTHDSLDILTGHSDRFVEAACKRSAPRRDSGPPRLPFPSDWKFNLQAPLSGIVIFLRRTNDTGHVEILGKSYLVEPQWTHRLIRAEVDLTHKEIRFFKLRRREPTLQPLAATHPYDLKQKPFHE